ncbi:hypothetical protein RUND412_006170 [Rhizina undulata]
MQHAVSFYGAPRPAGLMAASPPPRETIGVEVFGLSCTFALIVLRMWVQRKKFTKKASTYVCEICVLLAFFADCFITALDVWSSRRQMALGENVSDVELNELMDSLFMKLYFAAGICYTLFLWLVKASFIALYFNISGHLVPRARIALYIVTAFVATTCVASILMKFLWCRPFHRNWSIGPDKCTFAIALPVNTTTTVFNITTDVALLSLFVFITYTLQLRNRELLGAIFVLIVGTCTVVTASIRFAVIYGSIKQSQASYRNTKKMLFWTNVEMGMAMLAVCLPAFRVLLRKRVRAYSNGSRITNRYAHKSNGGVLTYMETELTPVANGEEVGSFGKRERERERELDEHSVENSVETGSMKNLCQPVRDHAHV